MNTTPEEFDRQVRSYIYTIALERGFPPTLLETSESFNISLEAIHATFQRLAAEHILVLQADSGEILMANPFSAVPTPFLVETKAYSCFGNCIWDSLGIPAMLKQDARIRTACPDCGTVMELEVRDGVLQTSQGLIHFAVPARHWWEEIVFT